MILGAIADDLTGATDLSLVLARSGMRVVQCVGVSEDLAQFASKADAVVIALKSRTNPATEAVSMSLDAARALKDAGAQRLFFKYCSTFDSTADGNIGPVVEALMQFLGTRVTIACPAFPENGRTVYKGHLFVGDQLISDSPMKDHPLTPMTNPDLVALLACQTDVPVHLLNLQTVAQSAQVIKAKLQSRDGIWITDAIHDADLIRIGQAVADLRLLTGGSAVAMGLAEAYRDRGLIGEKSAGASFRFAAGRTAILAGSCSEMTRRQLAYARAQGFPMLQVDALSIAEGRSVPQDAVNFAMAAGNELPPVIYSSADPQSVKNAQNLLGRARSGEIVEAFLAQVAVQLRQRGFSRFIAAGGETSGAIVHALDVSALEIGPEIAPGVPWVNAVDTDTPLCMALKSGNFGNEDFFETAWRMLQ